MDSTSEKKQIDDQMADLPQSQKYIEGSSFQVFDLTSNDVDSCSSPTPNRSTIDSEFVANQIPPSENKVSSSPNVTRLKYTIDSVATGTNKEPSVCDSFVAHNSSIASPRLIQRNLPYNQSHNRFNTMNKFGQHRFLMLWNLYKHDWFHVMLRWPTMLSVLFFIGVWTTIILVFAGVYMGVDRINPDVDCGLAPNAAQEGPIQWYTAFAFSLETCTTVGYGLPGSSSAFFQNCPEVQISIYFQMIFSMFFNAFLLTFFYVRIARCEKRAYQVVFTDKAVIRRDQTDEGRLKFECKVYDADSKHPVVEAHVRMYVVHCNSANRHYLPLRIMVPNDDLGAKLCTSIPSHVQHNIDLYSPLLPPRFRPNLRYPDFPVANCSGLSLREVDSYTGNREGILCPVCGESYGTFERLENHVKYNRMIENYCGIPPVVMKTQTHHFLTDEVLTQFKNSISLEKLTYEDLSKYFSELKLEVVVLVEGIDPLTSGTFQALHSYQAEDIIYGGKFAVAFTHENEVDFELFQTIELVEAPFVNPSDVNEDDAK